MRICVAQSSPVAGDIQANIDRHLRLIDLAVMDSAELVVFPELSITGYEPTLARELAVEPNDRRFEVFQNVSDTRHISIGIGAPTQSSEGIRISLVLFQPGQHRRVLSKRHLHVSEEPFFVRGPESANLIGKSKKIALAICYELSVPEHAAKASRNSVEIYLASVADSVKDIDRVTKRLATIAQEHSMNVLMSNYVGTYNGYKAAGRTSAWTKDGVLLSQLDNQSEGFIVMDTNTMSVTSRIVDPDIAKS